MRLPLIAELDSRDGTSNKDARFTNVLKETEDTGEVAAVRPALVSLATATGNGNGSTVLDGVLVTVFGTALGTGTTPTTISAVIDGKYDFCASPL